MGWILDALGLGNHDDVPPPETCEDCGYELTWDDEFEREDGYLGALTCPCDYAPETCEDCGYELTWDDEFEREDGYLGALTCPCDYA